MPLCSGCPCPGWKHSRFCLRGEFRREDAFLEQLTVTEGTQQSGPSKIGLDATFRHTRGVVWMEMPQLLGLSYQVILLSKTGEEYYWQTVRKKQSVWIVRLRSVTLCHQVCPCVSAQAHCVERCTVGWVVRLVCVTDSYLSLNSVLCAEHFYYVLCLDGIFPACCWNCICMQLCSMLGDINEPLTFNLSSMCC